MITELLTTQLTGAANGVIVAMIKNCCDVIGVTVAMSVNCCNVPGVAVSIGTFEMSVI